MNKLTYNEKKNFLMETDHIKKEYENYIPVFIQIDSNVLSIDKKKVLVNKDITFVSFLNQIEEKIINLQKNDKLRIVISKGLDEIKISDDILNKTLNQIYVDYQDLETQLLILKISRRTMYKWIKNKMSYYTGYSK
jgi:GTP-binding protein EngB required for normal cell division